MPPRVELTDEPGSQSLGVETFSVPILARQSSSTYDVSIILAIVVIGGVEIVEELKTRTVRQSTFSLCG